MNAVEKTIRRIDRFQQRHAVVGFPFAVIQKFGNDQGGAYAARIAYRGLFALFPLLLLLTTAVGFFLSDNAAFRRRVLDSALAQFPIIGPQLQRGEHVLRGSGLALIVGVLGTVWATLGLGQAAESAMNALWNVPYVRWPNFWLRRLRSAGLLLALGVAIVLSAALSTLAADFASGATVPLAYAGAVAINLLTFMAAFVVLTAEPLAFRDVLWGAAIATFFWEVLQLAGGWYVSRELRGASETYGFFALVIVLLSWMYLAAQLTLLAVESNVVRKYRLWPRSMTQPPLTDADRAVFRRLADLEVRRPEYDVRITFHAQAERDPLRDTERVAAAANGTALDGVDD